MSLDGAILHQISNEIVVGLDNARVEKIVQPSRDEVIIHLRSKNGNKKLLINTSANNARVHFTNFAPENPAKPPMFCMLLRKLFQSSRLVDVKQEGLDRILSLVFEGYNELGDKSLFTIVVEIMGRYSNIIILNSENRIIDALKKIDFAMSEVRQILPGLLYIFPQEQNKLNIVKSPLKDIVEKIKSNTNLNLSKAIINSLQGFSPLPTREISYLATNGEDTIVQELTPEQWEKVETQLEQVAISLKQYSGIPTMVLEKNGRPKDFSFMPIQQYEGLMDIKTFNNYSEMLDYFFVKKDTTERIRQRSGSLLKLLENTSQRISRRLAAQMEELEECKLREELKIKGDLLTANIHQLKKGYKLAKVLNFYDDNSEIEIDLNIRKTPAQNAQSYYLQYRKADTAEKKLTVLTQQGIQEQEYIDSVLDSLKRSETEADLESIKNELVSTGYLKKNSQKKTIKLQKQDPHIFNSTDGFKILAGRNNIQNDRLTLKESNENDIWLHTQKIPGSHVIIKTEGKSVPDTTIEQAAVIAAYHSKAQNGAKVPVDYTLVKFVKKISGAKPGMVIYDNFKTIIVDPKEKIIVELEK